MMLPDYSSESLLDLYDAVRRALAADDLLPPGQKQFLVREGGGWRQWARMIEARLDEHNVEYQKIVW